MELTKQQDAVAFDMASSYEAVSVALIGTPDQFGDQDAILEGYRDGEPVYRLWLTPEGTTVRGRDLGATPGVNLV